MDKLITYGKVHWNRSDGIFISKEKAKCLNQQIRVVNKLKKSLNGRSFIDGDILRIKRYYKFIK